MVFALPTPFLHRFVTSRFQESKKRQEKGEKGSRQPRKLRYTKSNLKQRLALLCIWLRIIISTWTFVLARELALRVCWRSGAYHTLSILGWTFSAVRSKKQASFVNNKSSLKTLYPVGGRWQMTSVPGNFSLVEATTKIPSSELEIYLSKIDAKVGTR